MGVLSNEKNAVSLRSYVRLLAPERKYSGSSTGVEDLPFLEEEIEIGNENFVRTNIL